MAALCSSSASTIRRCAIHRAPVVKVTAAARPKLLSRPSLASQATLSAAPLPTPSAHVNDAIWLQEKLNDVVAGLEAVTRRAKVRALRVLHVTAARISYNPNTQRPRCTALDLDIAWEAEPVGAAALAAKAAGQENLQGLARVKLTTRGGDRVQVTDVQVLDQERDPDGAPCMPSGKAAPPDVLLAVQSLDGAIMANLNGFMWELEQAQAENFPLRSFELDEEDVPEFDASLYTTSR